MTKKIVKLSVVRTKDAEQCPFGLSIPFGCKYAGDIVDKMAPLSILGDDSTDEEQEKIKNANKRLLAWKLSDSTEKPTKCRYADSIIAHKDAVVCNYDDTAPGVGQAPLLGAPFYSRVMSGTALNGLYSYPIGYYADYNISRNLYYGIYSIQADKNSDILKVSRNIKDTINGACILFYCPEDSTILLLKRSKKVNNGGSWGLPGGHVEDGEFPEQAAIRELYEEMGFTPDPKDIMSSGHVEMKKTSHCVIFVVAISKETKNKWEEKFILNDEHDEYKWFETSDIPNNLHPVAEFILEDSANIQE